MRSVRIIPVMPLAVVNKLGRDELPLVHLSRVRGVQKLANAPDLAPEAAPAKDVVDPI
jgi:hypothetical protein